MGLGLVVPLCIQLWVRKVLLTARKMEGNLLDGVRFEFEEV